MNLVGGHNSTHNRTLLTLYLVLRARLQGWHGPYSMDGSGPAREVGSTEGHSQVVVKSLESGARLPGLVAQPHLMRVNECGTLFHLPVPQCLRLKKQGEYNFKTLKVPNAKHYNSFGSKT